MDDIMAKIQSVLSDKESMEQLSQLAQMFTQPSAPQEEMAASPPPRQQSAPVDLSQLMSVFGQGQSGSQSNNASQQNPPGFDIGTVMALQSVMSKASEPDKNRDFLIALKPLLKEESQRKIDRLVAVLRIMAILPALKESGILGGDLLGIL